MGQQIFTAHGFDFVADTMDWIDRADADEASERLGEIIRSFSAEEAAELHGLLTAAAEGEVDWDHPKLEALEDRCRDVASEVMKDYLSSPATGHNCTIAAA
ncbi:MAG: hypothetical protein VX529_06460 [Pseudomonadota bacterium]|nr:hypothetical protein [Pseudomonadota bacterium]